MLKRTKMQSLKKGNRLKGILPDGCIYCGKGAKMVLLITGKCKRRCFYCPLSEKKRNKDVIYANELLVKKKKDIIEEAKKISALGTGITGGDPLQRPKRTIEYIKLLKKNFGKEHHIHLYTAESFPLKYIKELENAGLDEIRFHPPLRYWKNLENSEYDNLIKKALKTKMKVGVEVPVIPNKKEELITLIKYLDSIGVDFVNLNELEYSETNYKALNKLGFNVKNDISSAVLNSEKTAKEVIKELNIKLSLHYCSSSFKNAVQLKNRILRRAKNVVKEYEIITKDCTLLKGVIEIVKTSISDLKSIKDLLIKNYKIDKKLIAIDKEKNRIEIASWVIEKLPKLKNCKYFVIEEYPTADRLEVEREEI